MRRSTASSSATTASNGAEGTTSDLRVRRIGGSSGNVSVTVEVLHATTSGSDIQSFTRTLAWSDGDAAPEQTQRRLEEFEATASRRHLFEA